jgi:hypothetical protein
MRILVSGGAGYIGSHTCLELLEQGHEVVVFDNFCNSSIESLNRVKKITGKEIDVLRSAWKAIDLKLIDYDLKRPRAYANKMFVFDADKVLKMLGCEGYYIEKVDELPKGYDGYYIVRYTLEGVTHFVLPDYNSLTYSNTVANGRKSKYYLVKKR